MEIGQFKDIAGFQLLRKKFILLLIKINAHPLFFFFFS